MKQNLLKTVLFSTALVVGTMGGRADNGNGIITTLPVTEDFEAGTGIFSGGEICSTNAAIGNVLNVYKTKNAVATFDTNETEDGNQAYTLGEKEKVTISFTAYHGYCPRRTTTFAIANSAGKNLVSYTYNSNDNTISDVAIGGNTVSGFTAFACQSQENAKGTGAYCYNGANKTHYVADTNLNPQITIVITGSGNLTINFLLKGKTVVDQTFSGNLASDFVKDLATISLTSNVDTNLSDRGYGIDNLSITSEITKDVTASYTIKKMCGDVELGTETATGIVGSTPTLDGSNFFVGDKKYIYVDNNVESVGNIATEGTVYTLNYREAAKFNYAVTGNVGDETLKEITSGEVYEGETAKIAYNRYILKDGKLYQAAANNKEYNNSFVVSEDNQKVSIVYKPTDKKNIVFFKEAEDIDGLTAVETGNANIRCSASKGAYAASDATIAKLPAGSYKIIAAVFGNKGTTFQLKAGENTLFKPTTQGYLDEQTSDEFKLDAQSDIVLLAGGNGGNSSKLLDYIIIEKTAEAVPVTDLKYASYVPIVNVTVPSDVKVYTGKVNEAKNNIDLTEIPAGTVIPAGTAVLVAGDVATYTFAASTEDAAAIADNELKAATAETVGDGKTIYALGKVDGKPVFVLVKDGKSVGEGHVYMVISDAANARYYSIGSGNGETTGINEVNGKAAEAEGAYYTLQGMKTNKPAKGLYIHNGKKVIVNK